MADLVMQIITMVLSLAIVTGGSRNALLRHYPFFYCYIGFGFLSTFGLTWISRAAPSYYLGLYWYVQFLAIAFGFGVIWEAYGLIFRSYPGSARIARFLVTLALAAMFMNAILILTLWHPGSMARISELEKIMRIVQAILLGLSWIVVLYYEIPVGRNVSGIIFGYGFFVIFSVLVIALRNNLGSEYFSVWRYGQPLAFLFTKTAWLYSLNAYHPAPAVEIPRADELSFPFMSPDARVSLARVKSSLGRALQP